MAYPDQFGHPCWKRDQADKCINTIAQVTKETTSLFLATHSPIKNIKDAKANAIITEEEVFKRLVSRQGEIRGVVRGDSGTGKSHLIRWVNLRAEYASDNKELGLDQFKIVMVQRDTGSLKAALKQIVNQLGDEFSQHIEDIKDSVDRFSAKTAREELIQELALEINSKWEQRGNQPLPRDLKVLGDILFSPG
jgi:Cdc6-like AAA superfamily ATPase